jgi:hypothetical protein
MTDTSPSSGSTLADRLRHPTTVLVLGALVFAMLGFLIGAVTTSGYGGQQWGPGVHMNGYDRGFPGGMMGRGPYDDGFPGGMMGWDPNGRADAQQGRVIRVEAGQVKSLNGNTLTLKTGAGATTKVKLTPNTYVVVHTLAPK